MMNSHSYKILKLALRRLRASLLRLPVNNHALPASLPGIRGSGFALPMWRLQFSRACLGLPGSCHHSAAEPHSKPNFKFQISESSAHETEHSPHDKNLCGARGIHSWQCSKAWRLQPKPDFKLQIPEKQFSRK